MCEDVKIELLHLWEFRDTMARLIIVYLTCFFFTTLDTQSKPPACVFFNTVCFQIPNSFFFFFFF